MGTSALVGVLDKDMNFRAARVHWDGYPTAMGVDLAELIERDGLQAMLRTVLGRISWSGLGARSSSSGLSFEPGFGEYHTDIDELITGNLASGFHNLSGTEWAYFFSGVGSSAEALIVFGRDERPVVRIPVVLLSDITDAGWTKVQEWGGGEAVALTGLVSRELLDAALESSLPALPSELSS